MVQSSANASLSLGFLTIVQEGNSYLGGYLVTNFWGRPLEFRLSSAVQPSRIHQILYGGTLEAYICGELIGKTLVEKGSSQPQLVVADRSIVLNMRPHVAMPVIWLPLGNDQAGESDQARCVRPASEKQLAIYCSPTNEADAPVILDLLGRVEGAMDLAEPFQRIREAMGEARKMGVMSRAS